MRELRRDMIWGDMPKRGSFGKEFEDAQEKELYLSCECGIEALKLNRFIDEDEYY